MQELQDRVAKAKPHSDEMLKIRKEIVDFHGEMVLLENYSALNYTGTSFLSFFLSKYNIPAYRIGDFPAYTLELFLCRKKDILVNRGLYEVKKMTLLYYN